MAHHKSAIKRIRTNKKENLRNRQYRTVMRSAVKRVREGKAEELVGNLRSACAVLDRLAQKGIIHPKTAARRKSRLHRFASRSTAQLAVPQTA